MALSPELLNHYPGMRGMVVIPKREGLVQICVDLKLLNQNVLCMGSTSHPKVDDTLAQLAGAKVFSKIDVNSEFWKILLAKESHPLTTFITPYGYYLRNVRGQLHYLSKVIPLCKSLQQLKVDAAGSSLCLHSWSDFVS